MGKKSKTSRKNKKAWRKNIATDDIDEFIEKTTKDALSGGSLEAVPSESLFYVDKSSDLAPKRKIDKNREKVLRCDSLLQRNPFVKPVPSSIQKKSIRKLKEALKAAKPEKQDDPKKDSTSGIVDIWADSKVTESAQADKVDKVIDFLPVPEVPQFNKKTKPSVIPAVEIEPPGCSFNPSHEDHQDSLAVAVAEEMQKIYKSELAPQPVPLIVTGEVVDEEDMYFLDADGGSDSDVEEDNMGIDNDLPSEQRASKKKRVTRVEHNRRVRRKEVLKAEAEKKKKGKLAKEINSVADIMKEIEEEDEEKQKRHDRRVIAKQERLKSAPPRLGKHKFEPAPMQVLLSEEISGSLRKLKGCSTLARDRFKSLEKRGMVVPSAKRKR